MERWWRVSEEGVRECLWIEGKEGEVLERVLGGARV